MNDKTKRLMELTEQETAELDRMAVILNAKHEAISKLHSKMVQQILVEELERLKRIQTIEKERAMILKDLSLSGKDLNDSVVIRKKFGEEDSKIVASLHSNLKESFARVVSLNGISRALLRHSLAFIRQNINILTEGGKRKLIDRKA
ncbi:MAG TPA: flagellar export chaperone FlgN [Candidatus Acidoferrales bacterium]|nr:flagellar export chaperone FlgN [Candidatus Acidoferrales bacterium]